MPDTFACIDPGSDWGEFYRGAFEKLLLYGYLDEGSQWLDMNTGIKYRVKGKPVPVDSNDDYEALQKLEEIHG